MIARRGGHHTSRFLLIRELYQFVVGPANLERKRRLQVFALEQDLVAEQRRERRRHLQRSPHRQVVDRRGQDLFT